VKFIRLRRYCTQAEYSISGRPTPHVFPAKEILEVQNRPFTPFASNLKGAAPDNQAIHPIWRRLFGGVDLQVGLDRVRCRSRGQSCHYRHHALAFDHVSVSPKDAGKHIGLVRSLLHSVLTIL
jgi:hypothetical protein